MGWVDRVSILYTVLTDDSSCLLLFRRERNDRLVSNNGEILHHQLALLAVSGRKHSVIAVFEVVAQVLVAIWIEEGIDKVNRVVEVDLLRKDGCCFVGRCAWPGRVRCIRATINTHLDTKRLYR